MKKLIHLLYFLTISITQVQAENYYLDAVNSSVINAEALQKSKDKIQQHKDIILQNTLEVSPFHKRQEWQQTSLSLTFCSGCHLQPPHTKNVRSRVFLNMHTEFIACETCHLRPENITFEYQWFDYKNQQVVPPDFNLFRQDPGIKQVNNTEKDKAKKKDVLVKIAPFWNNKPGLILKDHKFASDTFKLWKHASLDIRTERRAKIHQPLKEKGPECIACHQNDKPLLDLAQLGANKRQIKRIQQHIIPQFFKRYKEDDQHIRINNLLK